MEWTKQKGPRWFSLPRLESVVQIGGTSAADIETIGSSKAGNGILVHLTRENRV